MNAQSSHFTCKLLVILGAFICAQSIRAQNLWEMGCNIAGEAVKADLGIEAEASIGGEFTSGKFRTPSMGETLWCATAQADAAAAYEDLYLKGNFGFELIHGTNMMGSMFADPGYFPVDILEFTPGNKLRQNYDIGGGVAWKNSSRWTPGVQMEFHGVNYAKRKDLRHTTYRQEFDLSPSVAFSGDGWMMGLTYSFGKTSEFITASVDGVDNAQTYYAFLDKGMRYGIMQAWDGVGIHLTGDGVDRFPVKQFSHSVSLQGSVGDFLYADVKYSNRSGEIGEKGYVWFRFPGHSVNAKIVGAIDTDAATHMVAAFYQWDMIENYSVVMDKVATGGVVTPVVYGSNRIFVNKSMSFGTAYAVRGWRGWKAGAELGFRNGRDLSTYMYPYFDNDEAWHMDLALQGEVSVWKFDISAIFRGHNLVGSRRESLEMVDKDSGVYSSIFRLQELWDMEQEITDSPQIGLEAQVRFNFGPGLFIQAGCAWTHAFNVELLPGCDRQTTHLKFGYNF